jgi:hypothetical protein
VLTVGETRDRSQNEDGGESGKRPHAGVRQQQPCWRIGPGAAAICSSSVSMCLVNQPSSSRSPV